MTLYLDGGVERIVTHATRYDTVFLRDIPGVTAVARRGPAIPSDPYPSATYQLADYRGSATCTLDGGAAILNREEYAPYGETSFGGYERKRYRFTAKERDEESGLSYHGARYYAPWLARWLSCDPQGYVDGHSLYTYARNNPFLFTDPTGREATPSPDAQALAARHGIELKPVDQPFWGHSDLNDVSKPGTAPFEHILLAKDMIEVARLTQEISFCFLPIGELVSWLPKVVQSGLGVYGAVQTGLATWQALVGQTLAGERISGWERVRSIASAFVGLAQFGMAGRQAAVKQGSSGGPPTASGGGDSLGPPSGGPPTGGSGNIPPQLRGGRANNALLEREFHKLGIPTVNGRAVRDGSGNTMTPRRYLDPSPIDVYGVHPIELGVPGTEGSTVKNNQYRTDLNHASQSPLRGVVENGAYLPFASEWSYVFGYAMITHGPVLRH